MHSVRVFLQPADRRAWFILLALAIVAGAGARDAAARDALARPAARTRPPRATISPLAGYTICDSTGNIHWSNASSAGFDYISAGRAVLYQGSVVVGGDFDSFDGIEAPGVIRLDAGAVTPLGNGAGSGNRLTAYDLLVDQDGTLLAGGSIVLAGPETTNVARWNGAGWTPLGPVVDDGGVLSLALYQGHVYAGTDDGRVLIWDGNSWSLVRQFSRPIMSMTAWNGHLAVASTPRYFGAGTIETWDGAVWTNISGTGVDDVVYRLAVQGGDLLACGWLSNVNGVATDLIARWNGTLWGPVGNGTGGMAPVTDLVEFNGTLYACGWNSPGVMELIAGDWVPVGGGVLRYPQSMVVVPGSLVVAGDFSQAGDVGAWGLAGWDGAQWSSPRAVSRLACDGIVRVLADYQGDLVAGGSFTVAGPVVAHGVARLSGGRWTALGDGLQGVPYAAVEFNGNLVVGGALVSAGGVPVSNIARWDGSAWHALDVGVDGTVFALAVHDGRLVAGGSFQNAGGSPASRVAQWDGSSWTPRGAGLGNTVRALHDYQGDLVAGGDFLAPGAGVARWDGATWSAVGGGLHISVRALEEYGGDLIAGGDWSYYCGGAGDSLINIARFDGTAWHPMGLGLCGTAWDTNPFVAALTVSAGRLVAAGSFLWAGTYDCVVNDVAAWDGSAWIPLGSGLLGAASPGGVGYALFSQGGHVYVGGDMIRAGDRVAPELARWDDPAATAVPLIPPLSADLHFAARPNPFSTVTTFEFDSRGPGPARLSILDLQGRLVRRFTVGAESSGGRLSWDGRDERGAPVPPGFYFGRLATARGKSVLKLVRVR